jgi:hypothetical protein
MSFDPVSRSLSPNYAMRLSKRLSAILSSLVYSSNLFKEYQLSERPFSWSIPRSFVDYDIHGIKGNNSETFEPIYFYYGWYLINDVIIKMEHLRSIYENTTLLGLPPKIPANICAQAERYNKEEHLAIKYGLRKVNLASFLSPAGIKKRTKNGRNSQNSIKHCNF